MNMVRFGFPELSTLAKWSPKNPENFWRFSAQKIKFLKELSKKFGLAGVENSLSIAEIQWIPIQMAWPHIGLDWIGLIKARPPDRK